MVANTQSVLCIVSTKPRPEDDHVGKPKKTMAACSEDVRVTRYAGDGDRPKGDGVGKMVDIEALLF